MNYEKVTWQSLAKEFGVEKARFIPCADGTLECGILKD